MKLGIVTDSTSDLPQNLIEEHALEVIPTLLILDGKEYADGKGISRASALIELTVFESFSLPMTHGLWFK